MTQSGVKPGLEIIGAEGAPEIAWTADQLDRYSRQLSLSDVGLAGQSRLQQAKVLLVGAGGLGCPIGLYLASMGVGQLTVMDADVVSLSNLHRQVAYQTSQVGQPKASRLAQVLADLNPTIKVSGLDQTLDPTNAAGLVAEADLVIDGTDNLPTRFLLAEVCQALKRPFLYGALHQWDGQWALFTHATVAETQVPTPCFRCLFPTPPGAEALPNCAEAGVMGVLPGVIGTMMVNLAVQYLLNPSAFQSPEVPLYRYDGAKLDLTTLTVSVDPDCPLCQRSAMVVADKTTAWASKQSGVAGDQEAVFWQPVDLVGYEPMAPTALAVVEGVTVSVEQWQVMVEGQRNWLLLDVRTPWECAQLPLTGALNIPLDELDARLEELPHLKETPLLVVCAAGQRSLVAVTQLEAAGYVHAYSLLGGLQYQSADEKLWLEWQGATQTRERLT